MIPALRLELRRGRMLVLWVGLVAVLYAGGITLFYPVVLDNAAEVRAAHDIYPKELMAAFGIEGSLGDAGTFLNSYVFQFLWPLVAAIAAILLGDADRRRRRQRLPGPAAVHAAATPPLPRLGDRGSGRWHSLCSRPMTIGAIVIADLFIEPDFPTDRLVLAGVHACRWRWRSPASRPSWPIALLDRGKAGGLAPASSS